MNLVHHEDQLNVNSRKNKTIKRVPKAKKSNEAVCTKFKDLT